MKNSISILFIASCMLLLACTPGNTTRCTDGKPVKIFGMVEVKSDTVYLVEKWHSRSKVSWEVQGGMVNAMEKMNGSLVIVRARVLEQSAFSGSICIQEIQRKWVENEPVTLKGIVLVEDDEVYIKEPLIPFSRRGLQYRVTGNFKDKIADKKGKSVHVKGILKQENNWSRITIEVKNIL